MHVWSIKNGLSNKLVLTDKYSVAELADAIKSQAPMVLGSQIDYVGETCAQVTVSPVPNQGTATQRKTKRP